MRMSNRRTGMCRTFVLPPLLANTNSTIRCESLTLFVIHCVWRLETAEPLENRWFLRVPTAENLKNLKTDCVCATSKKPCIAGLSERPGGVSAVGSLSCPLIERAKFCVVRQIAGAKFVQKRLNGGLIFGSAPLPCPRCKAAQIASQAETLGSLSFSVRGAGFPQKRCGRRSPALPVTSQTRCSLSPKGEIFSLCVSFLARQQPDRFPARQIHSNLLQERSSL